MHAPERLARASHTPSVPQACNDVFRLTLLLMTMQIRLSVGASYLTSPMFVSQILYSAHLVQSVRCAVAAMLATSIPRMTYCVNPAVRPN